MHKFHTFRNISPRQHPQQQQQQQQQIMLHQLQQGRTQPASLPPTAPSASQLLKSLLQSGVGTGVAAAAVVTAASASSATVSISQSGSSTGSAASQSCTTRTVPHQSRGTWQLGGRAIVLGASITTPTTVKASSQETSVPVSIHNRFWRVNLLATALLILKNYARLKLDWEIF